MQNHAQTHIQSIQVDFMDIFHDLHLQTVAHKKKNKNKRLNTVRRAIEVHHEKIQLQSAIHEWWEDI